MTQKPGDVLLGVIDFFGILIPGAVLVLLHGDLLLMWFGFSLSALTTLYGWIPGFVLAYVLGQFLLGLSVPLNQLAARLASAEDERFYAAVRNHVLLPPGVPQTHGNVYSAAYSYLRLHNGAALAEVERQAAEYKLFRSVTLLLVLDLVIASLTGSLSLPRLAAALAGAALAAYRFTWLLHWTYRLAFDFYFQLTTGARPTPLPARAEP